MMHPDQTDVKENRNIRRYLNYFTELKEKYPGKHTRINDPHDIQVLFEMIEQHVAFEDKEKLADFSHFTCSKNPHFKLKGRCFYFNGKSGFR